MADPALDIVYGNSFMSGLFTDLRIVSFAVSHDGSNNKTLVTCCHPDDYAVYVGRALGNLSSLVAEDQDKSAAKLNNPVRVSYGYDMGGQLFLGTTGNSVMNPALGIRGAAPLNIPTNSYPKNTYGTGAMRGNAWLIQQLNEKHGATHPAWINAHNGNAGAHDGFDPVDSMTTMYEEPLNLVGWGGPDGHYHFDKHIVARGYKHNGTDNVPCGDVLGHCALSHESNHMSDCIVGALGNEMVQVFTSILAFAGWPIIDGPNCESWAFAWDVDQDEHGIPVLHQDYSSTAHVVIQCPAVPTEAHFSFGPDHFEYMNHNDAKYVGEKANERILRKRTYKDICDNQRHFFITKGNVAAPTQTSHENSMFRYWVSKGGSVSEWDSKVVDQERNRTLSDIDVEIAALGNIHTIVRTVDLAEDTVTDGDALTYQDWVDGGAYVRCVRGNINDELEYVLDDEGPIPLVINVFNTSLGLIPVEGIMSSVGHDALTEDYVNAFIQETCVDQAGLTMPQGMTAISETQLLGDLGFASVANLVDELKVSQGGSVVRSGIGSELPGYSRSEFHSGKLLPFNATRGFVPMFLVDGRDSKSFRWTVGGYTAWTVYYPWPIDMTADRFNRVLLSSADCLNSSNFDSMIANAFMHSIVGGMTDQPVFVSE